MPSNSNIDFSRRVSPSELPELMDGDCTYDEFRRCLISLEKINRWLLGYRPTIAWLERLTRETHRPLHIVDVGSGGGDLVRKIARWAQKRRLAVQLSGIDLNPYATRAAIEFTPHELNVTWITGDAMAYRPERPVDIIVSSLMAHHLEDNQVVDLLGWMEKTANTGWFINDLERSERSYRLFRLMPWDPIVRHDGPVSFRRAFRREDWERFLLEAGIPHDPVTIEHWHPGRLCVGRWK